MKGDIIKSVIVDLVKSDYIPTITRLIDASNELDQLINENQELSNKVKIYEIDNGGLLLEIEQLEQQLEAYEKSLDYGASVTIGSERAKIKRLEKQLEEQKHLLDTEKEVVSTFMATNNDHMHRIAELEEQLKADHAASEEIIENLTMDYNEVCEQLEEQKPMVELGEALKLISKVQNEEIDYFEYVDKLGNINCVDYEDLLNWAEKQKGQ